jgi:hypothetical protein
MLAQATTGPMTTTWIVVVVVVVAIAAFAILWARQRSQRLRSRFGPEYERVVRGTGSRKQAEAELARREKRVRDLDLQTLPRGARDRYLDEWQAVQRKFVDEPGTSIAEADRLVSSVMRDRGYPMDDFNQRAADLSVEHAEEVQHYRAAHEVSLKNDRGEASTEEMRQAIVHYRALFESLLDTDACGAQARASTER